MSLFGRRRGRAERTTGRPTSSNGASSLHLRWDWGPAPPELVEVGATLTVVEAPSVPRLYFWALQAGFAGGAAHVGLQWHPSHPGSTAANWGGYGRGGGELAGTESPLPSARRNPNTRDYDWVPGRPYRLGIRRGPDGWEGLVDGFVLRSLHAEGDRLTGVVVWSEVFARCDDSPAAVRWSDLSGVTPAGDVVRPRAVTTSYQSFTDGGCTNTSSDADAAGGVLQRTNTERRTPPGATIAL